MDDPDLEGLEGEELARRIRRLVEQAAPVTPEEAVARSADPPMRRAPVAVLVPAVVALVLVVGALALRSTDTVATVYGGGSTSPAATSVIPVDATPSSTSSTSSTSSIPIASGPQLGMQISVAGVTLSLAPRTAMPVVSVDTAHEAATKVLGAPAGARNPYLVIINDPAVGPAPGAADLGHQYIDRLAWAFIGSDDCSVTRNQSSGGPSGQSTTTMSTTRPDRTCTGGVLVDANTGDYLFAYSEGAFGTRETVLKRVTSMTGTGEVLRADRIKAKLIARSQVGPADGSTSGSIAPTGDPAALVWVVAVYGEVVPQFGRGATYSWGVLVFDADGLNVASIIAGNGDAWPPWFDAAIDQS